MVVINHNLDPQEQIALIAKFKKEHDRRIASERSMDEEAQRRIKEIQESE